MDNGVIATSLLSSPIRLAGLVISNRTVMSAMSSGLGSEDGSITPETVAYYKARADGGVGLIVVEFTCVDRRFGRAETNQLLLDEDCAIEAHRHLVEVIRAGGARAGIQLHSPGQHADRRTLAGLPAGPSIQVSRRDGVTPLCRALEGHEIHMLIDSFGRAADRCVAAGYEAIELHGAHGYLLMAFLSPLKNQRDDEWGGDENRRLRFPVAVIRAVKAALGPDRPLIYRLSSSDFLPGGLGIEDMVRIAPLLVAAGVDAIDVSSGTIEGSLDRTIDPMSAPEGWRFAHCKSIKAAVSVPVMGVGPVRWPAVAEEGLAAGDLDIVVLGRPLLADPEWPRKAIAGHISAIRPCTSCNWCFDRVIRHQTIACAENPRTGFETEGPIPTTGAGRTAIVVGGGPGGMAAALDLADAGFHTELFESRPDLGGGLIASATPPHKDKLFWYLDYLRACLAASSVIAHTGVTLKAADILLRRPDAVVIATGARAHLLPLQGADGPNALSAYALLMGEVRLAPPGELPVVVYGGGETGCESAELLAARGYRVVLVTRSPARDLARSAEGMYRKHLRARLLANPAVTIRENSTITAILDDGIRLTDPSGLHTVAAACCVLAQGRQAGTPLAAMLTSAGIPFALVGDVEKIGRIGDAVHAARRAVLHLASRPLTLS